MTTTSFKKRNTKLKKEIYSDVEKIKANLIDTTYDLKHLLGNSYRQSVENAIAKTDAVKDTFADLIINKPFKAIGMAVATGALIGFLLKRK